MNTEVYERETRPNKKARRRKTRAPLEYVGEVDEQPRAVNVTPREQIPRKELGTIPKGFRYYDALQLIAKIGLDAWNVMGYPQRQAALTEELHGKSQNITR